ncbi:MAG TPA: hypothetical protein DCY13_18395, partial [Verrucomicrobiales bacterium]|nr:hypothetical protein [Verrucomicrobiales bacterium]
ADAAGRLVERFSQTSNATGTPEESERDHERRVRVGAALLQLDNGEPVWTALAEAAPADPSFRTHLIHGLPAVGTPARVLLDRLTAETDSAIRPAIFSALGEYDPVMLPQSTRDIWQPVLLELLRNEPDAGTRSMVEWLLRHWGYGETVDAVLQELAVAGQVPGREWHVTPSGITMIQITGPVDFQMGTTDPNYSGFLSPPHHRRIPRSFWIATRPVLLREAAEFPGVSASPNWAPNLAPETPALLLSQADARRFCNWLSRREGIAEDQLCYLDAEGGHPMPKANHLNLSGYRLPTEAEWEFTARAGSTNRFHFGETETHLAKYVWHDLNSEGLQHAALLRPNALGLFDTLGNADQWCDVPFVPYPTNTTAAAPAIDGYEYAAGAEATRFAALRTATGDELSTPLLVDWAHRGGSVLTHPRFLGSTLRDASGPRVIHQYITVRLVRSIPFPATSRSDLKGNPNPTDPSL